MTILYYNRVDEDIEGGNEGELHDRKAYNRGVCYRKNNIKFYELRVFVSCKKG